MKKNIILKNCWQLCRMTWVLAILCLIGCSDDKDNGDASSIAFNPNLPVEVSSINPTSGSYGQRLVIFGNNFGNDPSMVNVFIGGKKAIIISVKNQAIYCLVPSQAYSGEIKVQIANGEEQLASTVSDINFEYLRK